MGAGDGNRTARIFSPVEVEGEDIRLLICCVDDTDELSGDTSTGAVAEAIADRALQMGADILLGISRHQLLVHPDVPYTSHNSSMCFSAHMQYQGIEPFASAVPDIISRMMAPSSDPGFCRAILDPEVLEVDPDVDRDIQRLIAFGEKAKTVVCTKAEAYELAASIPWVELTEYGGTGQGVVGAIAGIGLRLGGNDGRFRGSWDLTRLFPEVGVVNGIPVVSLTAFKEEVARLASGSIRIIGLDGREAPIECDIVVDRKAKPILSHGSLTFVVRQEGNLVWPLMKSEFENETAIYGARRCDEFEMDNDAEECATTEESCRNCLYRRWTRAGFECMRESVG